MHWVHLLLLRFNGSNFQQETVCCSVLFAEDALGVNSFLSFSVAMNQLYLHFVATQFIVFDDVVKMR